MARACGSMAKAGPSGRKSVITRRAARGALVAAAAAKKLSSAAVDEGKFSAEDAAIVMDAGGTKSVDSAAAMAVSSVSASGATSAMWAAALEQVKAEVGGEDAAEVAVMKPRVGSVVDAAMMERALSMVKPLSKRATGSDWAAAAERCLAETEVKVLASDDSKFELIEDAAKVALAAQAGQKGEFSMDAMESALAVVRDAFPNLDEDEIKMCTDDLKMDLALTAARDAEAAAIESGEGADIAKEAVAGMISSTIGSIAAPADEDGPEPTFSASEWSSDLMEALDEVVSASQKGEEDGSDASAGLSIGEILMPFSPYTERINARLAMIGFALGAVTEMGSSDLTFAQQFSGEGQLTVFAWVLGVVLATVLNATMDKRIIGIEGTPFNAAHELALGRIAMLGFLGTMIVEAKFGAPFF